MLFLIALIIAFVFTFLCSKPLKKYPYVFYAAAVAVTITSVILSGSDLQSVPVFLNTYVIGLFTRGAFATALWCVVMWTGALPNGSVLIKKFMPVRGELSIFAAILTLGHNIGFGRTYFVRLFTDAGKMTENHIAASILTIMMLLIMIPLTVMSFPKIRKKMNAKLWKRIQRTAYAFYAMIYIHVLILYYPMAKAGREGIFFSILIYSIAFVGYAVCRIRKWYLVRKKSEKTIILNILSIAVFLIIISGVLLFVKSEKKAEKSTEKVHTYTISSVTTSINQTENVTTSTSTTSVKVSQTTVSLKSVSETTATTAVTETSTETVSEEETEEFTEEEQENIYDEPEYEEEPTYATEPSYVYGNGTYSASAYGYDGEVFVTITVENDLITSVSAYTEESDSWYFESAEGSVISQILSSQSTNVDAVSGATYSSNAIMEAVQKALNSAKN